MNKNARLRPCTINGRENRFPFDKTVNPGKKSGLLPLMGWNSWNAFGSGNTEDLSTAYKNGILNNFDLIHKDADIKRNQAARILYHYLRLQIP